MKLLPVSDRTQQAYWNCVRQLADHHHKAPEDVSPEELRQYFIFLKCEKKVARQTAAVAGHPQNLHVSPLRQADVLD